MSLSADWTPRMVISKWTCHYGNTLNGKYTLKITGQTTAAVPLDMDYSLKEGATCWWIENTCYDITDCAFTL